MAVGRDVAEPGGEALAHGRGRRVASGQQHAAFEDGAQPGHHLLELALAVAVDPGDADDLPGVDPEVDAAQRRHPAVVRRRDALEHEPGSPRSPERAAADGRTSRPTISRPSSGAEVDPAGRVATSRPSRSTATRSATRSTSSSLWLMKTTERPAAASPRRTASSSSASCGVSTAVGSSRIRISAPR